MTSEPSPQTERRAAARHRTLLGGIAREAGQHVTWDCRVRNLSEEGARLEVVNPLWFPETIEVEITAHQARRKANVVWRKGTDVGVRFVDDDGGGRLAEHDELVRLRAERQRLRSRLQEIGG